MGDGTDDLTDTWHGRFSYPADGGSVPFTARLEQAGDRLSGDIEEPGHEALAPGLTLAATVSGRAASGRVSFTKTYATRAPGYGTVRYEGRVRDGGLEIVGTWRIPGSLTGPFIMIRPRGLPGSVEARREEPVS